MNTDVRITEFWKRSFHPKSFQNGVLEGGVIVTAVALSSICLLKAVPRLPGGIRLFHRNKFLKTEF